MKFSRRNQESRPHAAVDMDSQDLQFFAAIRTAALAGEAALIVDIRLDRTAITGADVCHVRSDSEDFHSQFMSGNAGITVERHLAQVAADIGPADTDTVDPHERLAGARRRRFRDLNEFKFARLFELYRLHNHLPFELAPHVGWCEV